MDALFKHIDQHQSSYVDRLREACAIPSVSAQPQHRPDVFRMASWLESTMLALKIETKLVPLGQHTCDGQVVDLPPVVLGRYGSDAKKKTVLVYGHYDVQPALKSDGWSTDPWTLTEDETGRLFARGSTDDKGPVIAWLWVIEAHQKLGIDLPVNILMCFEGMEESGSEGLDDVIKKEAKGWFKDADCVCISDNYWLGKTRPCLTYGLRGVSYFTLEIAGPGKDLHSGGTVHEPMTDLVYLMSSLVKPDGTILVPGIMDQVAPLTGIQVLLLTRHVSVDEEKKRYDNLDFNLPDFQASVGSKNSIANSEVDTLMRRWRYPSLSLHGVEGAFYAPGAKTVIPAKVIGKFSIRTVPNQDPNHLTKLVQDYLTAQFKTLNSKNTIKVQCLSAGKWWISDPNHWNFQAGAKAIERVFGTPPDLIREGGSIPVTLTFQEELKKNVLLLPMGACDDGAHSINEKIDRRNYIEGIKTLAAYLHELAKTA